jgi:hypothetical protein
MSTRYPTNVVDFAGADRVPNRARTVLVSTDAVRDALALKRFEASVLKRRLRSGFAASVADQPQGSSLAKSFATR